MTESSNNEKQRPIKKFFSMPLEVSIWATESSGKTRNSIRLQRLYKDKNGEWKRSDSLRPEDLPKAIILLQKAYEYLQIEER